MMPTAARHQRVLACVQCQQRKVKCQRSFPCANCVRASVPCEQATRQRRRRFSERELLARLRHYEGLLRRHNIEFDPLHPLDTDDRTTSENSRVEPEADKSDKMAGRTERSKPVYGIEFLFSVKYNYSADDEDSYDENGDEENNTGFLHENDDMRHAVIKKAWHHTFQGQSSGHLLLFGSSGGIVDLSTTHPSQMQIFRLWQVYLDNVNPLLKVTHTPTLQARIIDAASDITNIKPTLEALMFSIYSISILSLTEDQCSGFFGSPKKDILTGYQTSCQQALGNCDVLQSCDYECLTALYLYLVAIRPATNPASLSSLLSVAIRIAQRIGIHRESMYSKWPPLQAEIRRRLWWSLVIFDNRICEMSDHGTTSLNPSWDCRIPLNVNDSELQPEVKATPVIAEYKPSEMIFVVLRCEVADFIRCSAFHLEFTNPCFNRVMASRPSNIEETQQLIALERTIEEKYLASCNSENPLHYMTTWTIRGYLAKYRLLQHYALSAEKQPDPHHAIGISYALRMLECDTNLMASPHIKGYLWLVQFHFPFLAYIHLLQGLKRWPITNHTETAWKAMTTNYMLRIAGSNQEEHRDFFLVFSRMVLRAWEAYEYSAQEQDNILTTPDIVLDIKEKIIQITTNFFGNTDTAQSNKSNTLDANYTYEKLGFNLDSLEYSELVQLNSIEELLKNN
ncbi:C6 zinc finger domain-containing protein [Nannizzia gypsea CBS 118893]|uniref:C6 finger domain transcription factor nscR n=1 Tax=Arthroderma gypseum (strain ATCC MYA-4604 / CBS 118893) TaxID=535722 RepID=E4V5G5_ARTGP|nr:C6 zinc finger domain-containing protein [Nannizzia gypsea CBS 118893]EFR05340.1 C6 zinc finger domain-containing protein [Nannizzia gypsea CBS 118893]